MEPTICNIVVRPGHSKSRKLANKMVIRSNRIEQIYGSRQNIWRRHKIVTIRELAN